jgi:hypothetical protein
MDAAGRLGNKKEEKVKEAREVRKIPKDHGLNKTEHRPACIVAACGSCLDMLLGPSTWSSRWSVGQGLRTLQRISSVMAAGGVSECGTGRGSSEWWRAWSWWRTASEYSWGSAPLGRGLPKRYCPGPGAGGYGGRGGTMRAGRTASAGCCVPGVPSPFPREGLRLQQVVAGVSKPGVHRAVCGCPEPRKVGRASRPSLLLCIAGGAVWRPTCIP